MKPRSTNQTGILRRAKGKLILSMSVRGHWQIIRLCRVSNDLIGGRVRAIGERVEFNTIMAGSIEPVDGDDRGHRSAKPTLRAKLKLALGR